MECLIFGIFGPSEYLINVKFQKLFKVCGRNELKIYLTESLSLKDHQGRSLRRDPCFPRTVYFGWYLLIRLKLASVITRSKSLKLTEKISLAHSTNYDVKILF